MILFLNDSSFGTPWIPAGEGMTGYANLLSFLSRITCGIDCNRNPERITKIESLKY